MIDMAFAMVGAMPKEETVAKIIEYISEALVPTGDGGYKSTLPNAFKTAWGTDDAVMSLADCLKMWEQRVNTLGHPPKSHDRIVLVPNGAVDEFYVSSLHLSYNPDVSVKGSSSACLCREPCSAPDSTSQHKL